MNKPKNIVPLSKSFVKKTRCMWMSQVIKDK